MQAHLNRKIARPAPNGASPRFGDTPHHSGPDVHRVLAGFNTRRLRPGSAGPEWRDQIALEATMRTLEAEFIERERAAVGSRAATAPRDAAAFVSWFESLSLDGPGQGDPLFPYLAERADREEMRWFLAQEVAGEAGFDDLVAMTQIGFPVEAKLELARNYWDEMGRGNRKGMHGPMLQTLARALDVVPTPETTVWEALALNNLMVGLVRLSIDRSPRRHRADGAGPLGPGQRGAEAARRSEQGTALLRAPRRARCEAFRELEPRDLAQLGGSAAAIGSADRRGSAASPYCRRALFQPLPLAVRTGGAATSVIGR